MEYQRASIEPSSFIHGLVSVLSANGAGMAEAVRKSHGWIPVAIVAAGGISAGLIGVLWCLFIWMTLSVISWILFLITAAPGSSRPYFMEAVKLSGWCMLPFSLAAVLLGVHVLIFTQHVILFLVSIWMVIAIGAGWSALTGVSRLRATTAAIFGVGTTFMLQMVMWFALLLIGLYLTG